MRNREADRTRLFSRRALFMSGLQATAFAALGSRLVMLQVNEHERYGKLAEDNRINQHLTAPDRGLVLDLKGRPLAINIPTYAVRIIPERTWNLRESLKTLQAIITLTDEEIERVVTEAGRRRGFIPVIIREDLDDREVARISMNIPHLPGVEVLRGLRREYPQGVLVSHLIGYVGAVSEKDLEKSDDPLLSLPELRIGKDGIERTYDQRLRGQAGQVKVEVNAVGRVIRELQNVDGRQGDDVRLSLDLELQEFTFKRLEDEQSASAVVMDVDTGAVLALASAPAFKPEDFTKGMTHARWNELITDPRNPLVNKAISGTYPPGSTFKMVVALAALELGLVGPDYESYCPGFVRLGRHKFHCWRHWGHGRIAMREALEQSCDVYFYDIAKRIGVDRIAEFANRFGLGHKTNIDLPGEKAGLTPTKDWKRRQFDDIWHQGETLIVGIGQGYMTSTPLQLALMTSRLANGGRAVTPHLYRHRELIEPEKIAVNPANLAIVLEGMHMVVNGERGTARANKLTHPSVVMAGKTGTAQVKRITASDRAQGLHKRDEIPWKERDHALFVGYAPYDKPRYACSVVVEHGGSGSKAAAPIARDILDQTLKLNIKTSSLNRSSIERKS